MKISYFVLLSVCAVSTVYAAPPTLGGLADYSYPSTSSAATNQAVVDAVLNLQKDVSSLKTRVTNLEIKAGATRPNTTTSITPAGLTEKSRYDYAYSVFKAGDYNRAIAEFQSIIQTYPTGEYADNSMYWSGEAFLKKGDKVRAMQSFDQILRTFPKSPKAADALLKLGITQASIGNKAKAKEYYDYLITTYPGTPSANNAYSKRLQLGY